MFPERLHVINEPLKIKAARFGVNPLIVSTMFVKFPVKVLPW